MENIVCKSCGGVVIRKGNYYVCEFCLSKWAIEAGDDVTVVQRANAWEALRINDFEKAAELFEEIILKDEKNHEAHWGRALAVNGIAYVTDYNENKKVPTCNNITEESFLTNKDVQKAISLAPEDIKESYIKQAEQIEKIRIEWLNKASKEPAYDVFISFKDSDREHGIERTQDSIDVQDLYTALVQKGYNVFFSRVTLRDKVSEQYEPYIYNALKTAKVMIVFGEKAEYFNAVWVKNEWSRFKTRIEKGEKHKNSLITVYKNVNPYEIPNSLTGGRQAIDYSVPSNFEVLMNHVKKVIEASQQAVKLEKKEIKGGKIAKKSAEIKTETIKTKELGNGLSAETTINEKQQLSLVHSYILAKQWEDAQVLIEDSLFNNPNLIEAKWYGLQVKFRSINDVELFNQISKFTKDDYDIILNTLNYSDKKHATIILNSLYEACRQLNEKISVTLLNIILPYNYEEREEKIGIAIKNAISKRRFEEFNLLLSTLNSKDVDLYIKYNIEFAKATKSPEVQKACFNNIISVDEGNEFALTILLKNYIEEKDSNNAIATFETILKYSNNIKETSYNILVQVKESIKDDKDCLLLQEFIKYYPGELIELKNYLVDVAYKAIGIKSFDTAKHFLSLALSVDGDNPKIYWGLCLVKTKSRCDGEIFKSDISLRQVKEYIRYLTMVDEARRQECFKIVKKQERAQQNKKNAKKASIIVPGIVAALGVFVFLLINIIIPNIKMDLWMKNGQYHYVVKENNLREFTIPNGTTNIPSYAFARCFTLEKVIISNTVEEISPYAFSWCTSLKEIVIPNSVKIIGYNAFYNCSSLRSVVIGNSVTSIGSSAFVGCSSLTSVVIGNSVTTIGEDAFSWCSSLEAIEIPNSVTSIGETAFYNCSSLTSIVIGNSVTTIGEDAFSWCSSLEAIEIPNSVTSIGETAFYNCSSLTIYCEAESKPSGWHYYWNYSGCPVVWGYKGEN